MPEPVRSSPGWRSEAATSQKPEELPALIAQLSGQGLAEVVSGWSVKLAPEIAARPEVGAALAGVHAKARQWQRLRELAGAGSWEKQEPLRNAYLALANHNLADADWSKTVLAAAEQNDAGTLEKLRLAAKDFGWEQKMEDVLWRRADKPHCPRPVLDLLWAASLAHGNARQLAKVSGLLGEADSKHERVRNSTIAAALLSRTNEAAVREFAGALHAAAPEDAILTVIHALALHQQGRTKEATGLIGALPPDALKKPRTALHHGAFLAACQRTTDAAEYLKLGKSELLLPEEEALVNAARAAANGGTLEQAQK